MGDILSGIIGKVNTAGAAAIRDMGQEAGGGGGESTSWAPKRVWV